MRPREALLRSFCLGLIVVQNSSLILVTSYSRTLTPPYLPSVAVFLGELLKLISAFFLLAVEQGSFSLAQARLSSLLTEHRSDTMKFAIPAFCYTVQNNLWYYALSNLDPITAAVTSQVKVITTAIASVLMLGRRLSALQWVAIVVLTIGLVVIQLPSERDKHHQQPQQQGGGPGDAVERVVPHNSLSGASAMLLATIFSAYAGVFLEKLFKTLQLTLWLQSIQLSLFATPISLGTMLAYDRAEVWAGRMLVGFNAWAWLTVVLSALGGIAVSMTLKYADNILKTFAVGGSIVLNCAVSSLFLGVPMTLQMVAGVLLVVGATSLFNLRALKQQQQQQQSEGGLLSSAASPRGFSGERSLSKEEEVPLTSAGGDDDGGGGSAPPSCNASPSSPRGIAATSVGGAGGGPGSPTRSNSRQSRQSDA